jgi:hypothetical protein
MLCMKFISSVMYCGAVAPVKFSPYVLMVWCGEILAEGGGLIV